MAEEDKKDKKIKKLEEALKQKDVAAAEIKKMRELIRHLRNVQDGCIILGEKMMELGEIEFGRILIANSMIHDNSKFYGIEWEHLYLESLENHPEMFKAALKQHQVVNSHHPEYWGGLHYMPRIALAEMVCDWYARSIEQGSDLTEFFRETACTKYDIKKNSKQYKEIKTFIELILNKKFKPIKVK